MGKLKEMVNEESGLMNRIKHNSHRMQMAGLGLFAKFDEERARLYEQILEASDYKDTSSLFKKLNTLSNGAFNLVSEEGQRMFDELVEAGEKFRSADNSFSKAVDSASEITNKAIDNAVRASKTLESKVETTLADSEKMLQEAFKKAKLEVDQLQDLAKEQALAIKALLLQVEEGDVKGRRPAKAKVEECEIFDARREIKGMKPQEAMSRYLEAIKDLA